MKTKTKPGTAVFEASDKDNLLKYTTFGGAPLNTKGMSEFEKLDAEDEAKRAQVMRYFKNYEKVTPSAFTAAECTEENRDSLIALLEDNYYSYEDARCISVGDFVAIDDFDNYFVLIPDRFKSLFKKVTNETV